ncbi:hypothetical protein THAOC_36436, partial [Thalassiosira oceanica]
MSSGAHYAEFLITGDPSIGIVRPMPGLEAGAYQEKFSFYYSSLFPDFLAQRSDDWGNSHVHACDFCCYDGTMSFTDWDDYIIDNEWEGKEPCQSGDTIGMLLNFNEGTLTVYRNNRLLGVLKDGLSGPYCWYVNLLKRSADAIEPTAETRAPIRNGSANSSDEATAAAEDDDDRAPPSISLPNRLTMADPDTAAATLPNAYTDPALGDDATSRCETETAPNDRALRVCAAPNRTAGGSSSCSNPPFPAVATPGRVSETPLQSLLPPRRPPRRHSPPPPTARPDVAEPVGRSPGRSRRRRQREEERGDPRQEQRQRQHGPEALAVPPPAAASEPSAAVHQPQPVLAVLPYVPKTEEVKPFSPTSPTRPQIREL